MNINCNYQFKSTSQYAKYTKKSNPAFTAINDDLMKEVPLRNVYKVRDNVYRGASPNWNLESLKYLKAAGVERIVDIAGYYSLVEGCKENGIEYTSYLIDEEEIHNPEIFFKRNIFRTKEEIVDEMRQVGASLRYSDEKLASCIELHLQGWESSKRRAFKYLTDFIQNMQKENVYVCCQHGINRTDMVLMLNSILNPKQTDTQSGFYRYESFGNFKDFLFYVERLYNNLTRAEKERMGWNKAFDEQFISMLKRLGR